MADLKVVVTDYVFESFDSEREILFSVPADLIVLQASSAPPWRRPRPAKHVLAGPECNCLRRCAGTARDRALRNRPGHD